MILIWHFSMKSFFLSELNESIDQYINVIKSYSVKNSEQEEGILQHLKKKNLP